MYMYFWVTKKFHGNDNGVKRHFMNRSHLWNSDERRGRSFYFMGADWLLGVDRLLKCAVKPERIVVGYSQPSVSLILFICYEVPIKIQILLGKYSK